MTCRNGAFGIVTVGLSASVVLAAAALAEPNASINRVESATASVTVHSVDPATRHLVVKRPSGELVSLKVPAEVRNFGQLKPGDSITATYHRETEIALLPPGATPAKDVANVVAAHAFEGQMPAGVAVSQIVVTGAVLAVDPQTHRLKIVSPSGGEVHEFTVVDPEGQKIMGKLKVGDKITASINEGMLISASRN